jgi:hypothetical protein
MHKTDKQIDKIKKILTVWNPLGDRSVTIKDLDEYETEANDIYFHITVDFQFPKKGDPEIRTLNIVREILNEAFDLSLTIEECIEPSTRIHKIVLNK